MLIRSLLLCPILAAAVLTATASPGRADFKVCNKTKHDEIFVAIGLYRDNNKGWESEGWYGVEKGKCGTIVEDMADRYYYLYVQSDDVHWDGMGDGGSTNFCIRPGEEFTLNVKELADRGDNPSCEKHGYVTKRFMRVDTERFSEYTFNIQD